MPQTWKILFKSNCQNCYLFNMLKRACCILFNLMFTKCRKNNTIHYTLTDMRIVSFIEEKLVESSHFLQRCSAGCSKFFSSSSLYCRDKYENVKNIFVLYLTIALKGSPALLLTGALIILVILMKLFRLFVTSSSSWP